MKFMIASDIHGSPLYCKQLLSRYQSEKADKLLLLGDLLYHGPRNSLPEEYSPVDVISMLNPLKSKILCVRGNCDSEVDQMVLEFPILADYAIITIGKAVIYMTHGHNYNEEHLPPLSKGDILLCGHTHIPKCTLHQNYVYMNPGSVSIPKENSHHGYMIYENDSFLWKVMDGNIKNEYQL